MNNSSILIAIFLSICILLGGIVGFYMTRYSEFQTQASSLKGEIADKKQQVNSYSSVQKEINDYKRKIDEAKKEKEKLQTDTIKLDEVVPKLLDSTETVANKFDVKFQDIRISPLVRAEDWNELPVEMTVLGTFDNISNFLMVMEQRKLINLAAGSMNVSVGSEVDKNTGSPMLSVNLSAKVYIL